MAGFGFFHNAFEYTVSTLAKAGKSFVEATNTFKKYIKDPQEALKALRRWKETKQFYRMEPWIKAAPDWVKPTESFMTLTPSLLKEKYQYLFEVNFNYGMGEVEQKPFLSFVTSEELSKKDSMQKMIDILNHPRYTERYKFRQDMEVTLVGARTTMFIQ